MKGKKIMKQHKLFDYNDFEEFSSYSLKFIYTDVIYTYTCL